MHRKSLLPGVFLAGISSAALAGSALLDIDTHFGTDGLGRGAFIGNTATLTDSALTADRKVVLAGNVQVALNDQRMGVVRLNADGSTDTSFSFDGAALVDLGFGRNFVSAVAVQPDGRILLAGSASPQGQEQQFLAVARLKTNGQLDEQFGVGGAVSIDFAQTPGDEFDRATAIAVLPDGRIAVGVDVRASNLHSSFAAARLHANGALDTSFGNGGRVVVPHAADINAVPQAMAVDAAGNLLLAGMQLQGTNNSDVEVLRLRPDGSLDPGFGGAGKVVLVIHSGGANQNAVSSVLVQPDGKLLLAGGTQTGTTSIAMLALRLFPDGALDPSFGTQGIARVDIAAAQDSVHQAVATGAALQGDGRLWLSGLALTSQNTTQVALARLRSDGRLDHAFNDSGTFSVATDLATDTQTGLRVMLEPDFAVVAVGGTGAGRQSTDEFAALRLHAVTDRLFDSDFE